MKTNYELFCKLPSLISLWINFLKRNKEIPTQKRPPILTAQITPKICPKAPAKKLPMGIVPINIIV